MRVISINTYAGSLLVGARMAGLEVDASLEDTKFGVDIQSMNFPGLRIFSAPGRWPKMDLGGHAVIAHPPCSAFSGQNNSKATKGTDSGAFACTKRVLDYAMENNARVILVESVMGALEGAREVHEEYAQKHGYTLYRFLCNSASFGVPQWRQRFWAVWVKGVREAWPVYFEPRYVKLRDVLIPDDQQDKPLKVDAQVLTPMGKNEEAWNEKGVPQETRDEIFQGKRGFGLVNTLVEKSKDYEKWAPRGFRSKHLRLLNPDGFAPVLLLDSGWLLPGPRRLYTLEYFRIMGFPDDYRMPEKYMAKQFKMYLSKGVCPPVAAWFLEQAKYWFHCNPEQFHCGATDAMPGQTLDLRPDARKESL